MPYTEAGLPFASGSQESYNAAVQAGATKGQKTRDYLRTLRGSPQTDHEAAASCKLPLSSVNSIRNSCVTLFLVRKTNERRNSEYGQPCMVWALTPAGEAVLRAWLEMGV